ncbi:MAG: cellulase family glycosylhydrolase [Anaerolineae bacterium]|nr:cellulase family glycosylhydrolase [Anaerolineae bacterium]
MTPLHIAKCGCLLLFLCLLAGCAVPVAQADLMTPSPSAAVTASPTPTVAATSTPTLTPTATATPTSIPTIVIPILTQTVTPTVASADVTSAPLLNTLPERVIPEPFGVNIHFTRPLPGEANLLAAAGYRWVRMDMFWNTVEQEQGRYTFGEYDALVAATAQRGIRVIFILDYGNPHYDHGFAPHSPEARAAFVRFAVAAARRYRDKGVVWEIWNEPNLDHFWAPQADVERYGTLLLQTAAAIRRADPTAIIVAPGTSGFDWPFWTALGDMGAFANLDAVTVHPYGLEIPEQAGPHYVQLATLLYRYSPAWKIPVLSGEWGYASVRDGISEEQQAQYLARQGLVNLAYDVNLSIWYDWRDDGVDSTAIEQNFGTVHHDLSPKPAYRAVQTLLTTLDGYRFMRRIQLERQNESSPDYDYVLLFMKEELAAMALWTISETHIINLPLVVDDVTMVEMAGERSTFTGGNDGLAVELDQSPRYLLFRADQATSQLAGWRPYETLQHLQAEDGYSVRVVFERAPISTFGEVQVRVQGDVRGSAPVVTRPMEEHLVRIPVDVTGLTGAVPAEVVFIPTGDVESPLQSAMVWLLIAE